MSFWRNLHVAITGASSGIGEALARELGAEGARLTLVARRKERMIGLGAHVEACDLSEPAQATAWIDRAEAALGPIDVLVNNAGATLIAPSDQVDEAEGERRQASRQRRRARAARFAIAACTSSPSTRGRSAPTWTRRRAPRSRRRSG